MNTLLLLGMWFEYCGVCLRTNRSQVKFLSLPPNTRKGNIIRWKAVSAATTGLAGWARYGQVGVPSSIGRGERNKERSMMGLRPSPSSIIGRQRGLLMDASNCAPEIWSVRHGKAHAHTGYLV